MDNCNEDSKLNKKQKLIDNISILNDAVLGYFESLYYVDLNKGCFDIISSHGLFDRQNDKLTGNDFFSETEKLLRMIAHRDDYKKVSAFLSRDNILSELNKGSDTFVSASYRLIADKTPIYYRIRVTALKSEGDHIMVAFENVNDCETRNISYQSQLARDKDIIGVLSAEYSAVYCVNLATNSFEICKFDDEIGAPLDLEKLGSLSFTEVYKKCVDSMVYEPDRPKMMEAGSIYNMMLKLKTRGSYSTVYRAPVNDRIQYCEMKIAKIGADEFPTEVVMCFADRSIEKNNEIERELNIQKILSLSRNLEAVAEINLLDGTYSFRRVFNLEVEPENKTYLREGVMGEDAMKGYIVSDIHKDDRPLLQSLLSVDNMLKIFKEKPSFEIKYRNLNGGKYIWRRMKGVLSTQNNDLIAILGIFNIDQEYRLELRQIEEVKKLSYDAYFDKLTGTRNRNAYVIKEKELNDMMNSGSAGDFAVAVFDVNCLKDINDNMGHDKGDEIIKTVAKAICRIFAHSPVFRIGGDEFAAFLTGEDFANREVLLEDARRQAKLLGGEMPAFATGAATRSISDQTVADVFAHADEAMYADKEKGKR